MVESDCASPVFAPEDTLLFQIEQDMENRARVSIGPVVSLLGGFSGDRLEARSRVAVPAPDSESPAGAAGDSLRYEIRLDFEGEGFEGEYRVQQPATGALPACRQVFALKGRSRG